MRGLAAGVATIGAAGRRRRRGRRRRGDPDGSSPWSGASTPVFVTQAPGEPRRFYVVEQGGTIRVVENGRVRATPFLDIRSRVVAGGEQGLLGLAFAPKATLAAGSST